ncbi:MAG TPA: DUF4434 domain-containing protein [Pantanalinema sp.]
MEIPSFRPSSPWVKPAAPVAAPVPSQGTVKSDRLTLSMSATAPTGAQRAPDRLTGSFIQISGDDQPAEYWTKTLSDMKRLGMDTAVIQYTAYDGTTFWNSTENILKAADELGMGVMVGTKLDESNGKALDNWYLKALIPSKVKEEATDAADYTRELVERFGHHPSMTGLYIPYEVNGIANAKAIGDLYGDISRAAKAVKPDLKVMISPYTNLIPGVPLSMPAKYLENWWDTVLSRAGIDVLAWQDGVGGTTKQLDRVEHDLTAISKAASKHGVELWANLETFHRSTKLYQGFEAEPGGMDTIKRQIDEAKPHVSKLINFDFNHYMSPQGGEQAQKLYADYMKYVETLDEAAPSGE